MTVTKNRFFSLPQRGASILEVLLVMAIVAMVVPFMYGQISKTNQILRDVSIARRVMSVRDNVLNFVRMNQDKWPEVAQIRLSVEELGAITPDAVAGLIDKYSVGGATITDVYLAFPMRDNTLHTNKIARHIGGDAGVVDSNLVAYGDTWAVSAPDFVPGDLVYRISRDINTQDTSKYLHRATSGEDGFNVMERDLDMAHHHIYNASGVVAQTARIKNANTVFVNANDLTAQTVYFQSGANIDGTDVTIGDMRVSGDMSGFKNVIADNLNGNKYTTTGRIVSDRITVTDVVNVADDLVIKADGTRTISGFTAINANSVAVPYISAEEMVFLENFGLTVSGELLVSTTPPIRFGDWVFQSTKPPQFASLTLSRATRPGMPSNDRFDLIMRSGWRITLPSTTIQTMATE